MSQEKEETRLAVSRVAARLFLERGVAATSGDDIAAAAGLSKRTVWRYFRSKESAVEPFFTHSVLNFSSVFRTWSRDESIEAHLDTAVRADYDSPQFHADAVLAARLIALLPQEPALRTAWLMSCHFREEMIREVISQRLHRPVDFEVRLCAATVMAALRIVDEEICLAAVKHAQIFTQPEVIDRLAAAIRAASTLPICDPIEPPAKTLPSVKRRPQTPGKSRV